MTDHKECRVCNKEKNTVEVRADDKERYIEEDRTDCKESSTAEKRTNDQENTTAEIEVLWKQAIQNAKKKDNFDLEKECYISTKREVPLIRFRAFDDYKEVNAFFSTRFGGESTGYLASLNLGFDRGDTLETVGRNFQRICHSAGVDAKNLVLSDQVHDTKVRYVIKKDTCKNEIKKKLKGIDGLVTDQKEVCLATSYADCVPLFFYDPVRHIIASSHSGWRGTVGKIGTKTIQKMHELFGSKPEEMIVVVGPSICADCYEVSIDVIEEFAKKYTPEQMKKIAYCSDVQEKKYQLNLWKANELQFLDAGVKKENIHISGLCTCCNPKLLYSHRASLGKRGNLNGFISLSSDYAL